MNLLKKFNHVLVTGGAGYVGSALIPKLIDAGYGVTVLDLYLYGDDIFGKYHGHEALREIKGDLRNSAAVEEAVSGCDAVIHLAARVGGIKDNAENQALFYYQNVFLSHHHGLSHLFLG